MNTTQPTNQPERGKPVPAPPPVTPEDASSQALAEALRSSFGLVKFVMLLLVAVFFASGFFTVGPQERAIILRLGKPVGEGEKALLGPGLHWSFPYPIDEVRKIPITEIQTVRSTVGWYAVTPEQELAGTEPAAGPGLTPGVDGYLLTADQNIVHARAVLYYRITDPIRYVFGFAQPESNIVHALDNALLYAAAQFNVDDILVRDVAGFREAVRRRVEELLARHDLGVVVEQCDVESRAPRQVRDAFNRVLQAEVTRAKLLDEARSYENQVLSKASADAAAIVNAAHSERTNLVATIAAEAARFEQLLPQYRLNPQLFELQLLTETLGRVLANAQDKIFVPARADGKPRELRLLLNREPVKPKTAGSGQQ
ncbi:MAG: FtsH protease activity modulator HflK [Verrucomicrobiae bacterium]|nr:FtsH protease activity modulator HflK [Verrucomicrobiae bacterium]MCX7722009.1 FtsH protease activity modulator HflK [Verrucomicrobiae bacterium]MDW7980904.1 FtsH protease activity modulator HflK [Verrucomicrobiales bacterium]